MASAVKYQCFAGTDLGSKTQDLVGTGGSGADVLKIMLSNRAPVVATDTVRADVAELSTAGGYTSGGIDIQNVGTSSGGTLTVVGTDKMWTATAAGIGPFRYVILYNDTATGDPLIQYWDYGSSPTMVDTQTFTVDFGASVLTIT